MGVSLLCTAAVIIIVVHSNGRIHIHFAPVSRFGHAISIALEPRSLAGDVSCKADINGPISLRRCIVSLFDGFMQFGKGADIEPSDICILRRICEDTGGRNHDRCNEHYGDEQRHYLADFSCLHNYHLSFDFAPGLYAWRTVHFSCPFIFRSGVIGAAATAKASVSAKRGHLSAYLYHYTVTLFYSRLFCLSTQKFKFYI